MNMLVERKYAIHINMYLSLLQNHTPKNTTMFVIKINIKLMIYFLQTGY